MSDQISGLPDGIDLRQSQKTSIARVLICVDWFDPGLRAGGPIRSCVNLIELLHEDLPIAVLTGDRDLGEHRTYLGVNAGTWNDWKGMAVVWYATRRQHFCGAYIRTVWRLQPQAIYLNSMFSVRGAVIPLLAQIFRQQARFIVAPRGMLKPSALSIRKGRKSVWLNFLRLAGVSRRIQFHATSAEEADEIRSVFGSNARITILPNIPRKPSEFPSLKEKQPGELRLSLVGRVHAIKNVLYVIRLLKAIKFQCSLEIVGPVEDASYYAECQKAIAELPKNVSVRFCGSVTNEETVRLVQDSHAMILPTLGENFGHAIFEALATGVPVVISDQTYWRDLEADHAGWDLPLDRPERFQSALEQLAVMGTADYQALQHGAHRRAVRFFEQNDLKQSYLDLFCRESGTAVDD